MKFLPVSLALLGGVLSSRGEEAAPHWDVEIPVPIADGTPSPPTPKPEPIEFEVLTSRTKRMLVTEAPEMSDLPPIKGTINVTVQMVKDPGLPDPPPPLPVLPPSDPAVLARMEELRKHYRGTELVFFSATVYDQSRTFLRIYPNGNLEGHIIAWSNVNFNHFSGFSTFRVKNSDGTFRDYGLLMGVGSVETYQMRQRLARHGQSFDRPEIPELPDLATSGPSFVVTEGQTDGEAMNTLSQIHDLYRKEGVRMEAAFHAREKAYSERKAYLLANPPVPKDVAVQFWKRSKSRQSQQNNEGSSAR
ncbi:MAG: hypothetical protein ACRCXD_03215 [Luteolibacter sp.]